MMSLNKEISTLGNISSVAYSVRGAAYFKLEHPCIYTFPFMACVQKHSSLWAAEAFLLRLVS